MLALARLAMAFVLLVLLAGCGGGGGGGDPGPTVVRGAFTLSGTTATFNAKRLAAGPPEVTLQMMITGSDVAAVGAAYRDGIPPAAWLAATITGSGNTYTVHFAVNTTDLGAATYTTTISVGTADAAGNVLQFKDVAVSYSVREGVSFTNPGSLVVSATLGHSITVIPAQLSVNAPNLGWTVSADVPWITDQGGPHQGSGTLTLSIDTSTLGNGAVSGTVTLTNTADPSDTASMPVNVLVGMPALTVVSASPLPFGGTSGLKMEPHSAHVALATGSKMHPWTAAFVPTVGVDWLEVGTTSGMLNETGVDIVLTPKPNALAAGDDYSGNVVVTVDVAGTPLVQNLPVSLNVDSQRIWVSANGVAFSSFPGRQTLTRTLRVFNSFDRTDLQLQASPNVSWLHASAPDGNSIVLSVDPSELATLAADQTHIGTVEVNSTTALIASQEFITVGVWRGSVDPPAEVTITSDALYLAAHPVKPEIFANTGTSIEVYNAYTGALVRTIPAAALGPMTFRSEGHPLYIGDGATGKLWMVDPESGTVQLSAQTSTSNNPNAILSMAYARPDARPILFSGWTGEAFDANNGDKLPGDIHGQGQIVTSKDGRRVYVQTAGLSPTPMSLTHVHYSMLNSLGFVVGDTVDWSGHFDNVYVSPGNGEDLAITEDDAYVYRANGAPYGFGVIDPLTLVGQIFLPATAYPAAVECGWRGYCFGTAGPTNTQQDVWIYDANQQYVGGMNLGSQSLYLGGIVFSPDDSRVAFGLTVPFEQRRIMIRSTPQ